MYIVKEKIDDYQEISVSAFETFDEAQAYAFHLLDDMESIGYQIVQDLVGSAKYAVAKAQRGSSTCELEILARDSR